MPEAFGLETASDNSWKYLVSTFETTDGKLFDLFVAVTRQTSPTSPGGQLGLCFFKLGDKSAQKKYMTVNAGFGFSTNPADPFSSVINPPTTNYFSSLKMQNCNLLATLPAPLARGAVNVGLDFVLPSQYGGAKGAPVGSIGALYKFTAYDQTNNISISLDLQDQRGTVFEGSNGNVATLISDLLATGHGVGSLEYANPRMAILSGTLKSAIYNKVIKDGNLWIDHQKIVLDIFAPPPPQNSPLYTGYWTALWLDNADSVVTATFYNAGAPLLSGSKTSTKNIRSFGTVIKPLTDIDQGFKKDSISHLWEDEDFTLNNHNYPSAVYTSPVSGKKYGTQFLLEIKGTKYYLKSFIADSEIYSTQPGQAVNAFYEGGVEVFSDAGMTKKIGEGFLEQMGRTNV